MTVTLRGFDEMKKNLAEMAKRMEAAVGAGLYMEAGNIMSDAKLPTPLKEGTLRASQYVSLPTKDSGKVVVELGYGGAAATYAVAVHERIGNVNWTEPGTGPKFLENALLEHADGLRDRVSTFARAAFESGSPSLPNIGIQQTPTGDAVAATRATEKKAHENAKTKRREFRARDRAQARRRRGAK